MWVRLGPNASGEDLNEATSVKCAPPVLCETPIRELVVVPSAPGQVGRPPSMNSDALPGLPCMGYRRSEVAFSSCQADGCLLVRPVAEQNVARSGEAGYCPCCARATLVPPPALYVLDEDSALKAERPARGGIRRLAALLFAEYSWPLSSTRDWERPHIS